MSNRVPLFISRNKFKPTPLWPFLGKCFGIIFNDNQVLPKIKEEELFNPGELKKKLADNALFLGVIKTLYSCKTWEKLSLKFGFDEDEYQNGETYEMNNLQKFSQVLLKNSQNSNKKIEQSKKFDQSTNNLKQGKFIIISKIKKSKLVLKLLTKNLNFLKILRNQ